MSGLGVNVYDRHKVIFTHEYVHVHGCAHTYTQFIAKDYTSFIKIVKVNLNIKHQIYFFKVTIMSKVKYAYCIKLGKY